ncbi:M3 family metallopeptidase [Shewanella sp. YIC-542]|uniref:M3 family metallopeptidase n=1 Tax=Shewanella mytili TaxID=3377111 RepID=UPI00398E8014
MLKRRWLVALSLAAAGLLPMPLMALQAVPLLVEQCLQYSTDFQPDFSSITALERQTLGLQNLADQIHYYRGFALSRDEREDLLECQLTLADAMFKVLSSPALPPLLTTIEHGDVPGAQSLAQRYQYLRQHQLSQTQKARLSTTQASIRQHLKSNRFHLSLGRCSLPADATVVLGAKSSTANGDTSATPAADSTLAQSIAGYLLQQPDAECRRQVWQQYQARAKRHNQPLLKSLLQLRQRQAQAAGYDNYAEYRLQQQLMGSTKNLSNFLTAMTHQLPFPPWDLGRALTSSKSTPVPPMSQHRFIQQILTRLTTLGISHEFIDKQQLRLWHHQRLLGEIWLTNDTQNQARLIRHSVVGQQFGQSQLGLKPQLTSLRDYQSAIRAVSRSLSQLAAGGRYYLNNALPLPQDAGNIGTLWLQQWLSHGFTPSLLPAPHSREQLIEDYQQNLALFHASVTLQLYQQPHHLPTATTYSALFPGQWPQTDDYAYSFSGIADPGPLLYGDIWQPLVADAIYQHTATCSPTTLFEQLLINEDGHGITRLLQRIWGGQPVRQIIARIHEGRYRAPAASQCPLSTPSPH